MKKIYITPDIFVLDFAEEPYCLDLTMKASSQGTDGSNLMSKDRGDNLIPSISMDDDE